MLRDIKSARRVLEIFEYFAERRAPAAVMDVAKALSYPQSSTSVLLRSLVALGYLDHDRRLRLYVPNVRIALVANWIQSQSAGDDEVPKLMARLRDATGESVVLGLQNGIHVQYAYVMDTQRHAVRWHPKIGTLRPMTQAALGQVLLATKPDAESRLIVRRLNAELDATLQVDEAAFMHKLRRIREQGYAFNEGKLTPGTVLFAMLLPPSARSGPVSAPVSFGVGGPAGRLQPRREEILAAMREVLGTSSPASRPITQFAWSNQPWLEQQATA